jgi:hypothetical protein
MSASLALLRNGTLLSTFLLIAKKKKRSAADDWPFKAL